MGERRASNPQYPMVERMEGRMIICPQRMANFGPAILVTNLIAYRSWARSH
jgi:hypothetical protein